LQNSKKLSILLNLIDSKYFEINEIINEYNYFSSFIKDVFYYII